MKTMITLWECVCERCGHKWASRVDNPIRCAKCKTPYWNRPRQAATENPDYPMKAWRAEARAGRTHLGYVEWVVLTEAREARAAKGAKTREKNARAAQESKATKETT